MNGCLPRAYVSDLAWIGPVRATLTLPVAVYAAKPPSATLRRALLIPGSKAEPKSVTRDQDDKKTRRRQRLPLTTRALHLCLCSSTAAKKARLDEMAELADLDIHCASQQM
ncbi:hypothetical protein [Rhizobium binae]|uniref:hypothetical protein n=1 Tax=Rhizobium binae TaxID=1138190 RepID=UPI001C836704|nr:hypothetical protein [Rhizobium binae]MBX4969862.1 hypothetical protein [Rhizobium binae]